MVTHVTHVFGDQKQISPELLHARGKNVNTCILPVHEDLISGLTLLKQD